MFSLSDLKTIFTYVVAIQMTSSCVLLSLRIDEFGQMFHRIVQRNVFGRHKNNNNSQRKHLFIRLKVDATGVCLSRKMRVNIWFQLLRIDNDSQHDTSRKTGFHRMLDTFRNYLNI